MSNKKHLFTAFFLASISCMMLTVAEPRQNARVNTNPHSESEKPVKAQKKVTPIFLEKEVRLKSLQNKHKQFWIGLMRKPKEKFNGMVNQSGVAQSFIRDFYFALRNVITAWEKQFFWGE